MKLIDLKPCSFPMNQHTTSAWPSMVALLLVLLSACSTPSVKPPLERVEGGYVVHLEKNALDPTKVNGKLVDLVVMDLGPLAKATTKEDTAAYVDAVMNESKYVVKVTGEASMDNPFLMNVKTEQLLNFNATNDHALVIDLHDTSNTTAHPNLHGSLGCGSCLLLNQFRMIYTTCLTGERQRCATCVSCEFLP